MIFPNHGRIFARDFFNLHLTLKIVHIATHKGAIRHAGTIEQLCNSKSTRVRTHKLLQVCEQIVTNLFTSCQQVVFALFVRGPKSWTLHLGALVEANFTLLQIFGVVIWIKERNIIF